jgi:hypothetical protein
MLSFSFFSFMPSVVVLFVVAPRWIFIQKIVVSIRKKKLKWEKNCRFWTLKFKALIPKINMCFFGQKWARAWVKPGNPNWRGRLSTVDLLIKIGCFERNEKYSFSTKRSWTEQVSTRKSTVLIRPFQQGFPGQTFPRWSTSLKVSMEQRPLFISELGGNTYPELEIVYSIPCQKSTSVFKRIEASSRNRWFHLEKKII